MKVETNSMVKRLIDLRAGNRPAPPVLLFETTHHMSVER